MIMYSCDFRFFTLTGDYDNELVDVDACVLNGSKIFHCSASPLATGTLQEKSTPQAMCSRR
jgi:hypothetical protein